MFRRDPSPRGERSERSPRGLGSRRNGGRVMDFHLPQLGEGVYEAELVRWLIHAGDAVTPGQGLMEVLTDKATMEVPAPFAGTVTELRVQPGSAVQVGDLILTYTPT